MASVEMKSLAAEKDLESGDSEEELEDPTESTLPLDRKRLDKTAFNAWLARKAVEETSTFRHASLTQSDNGVLSLRNMMAKQENNKTISDPREYQLELCERAKKENVIAVLPTGSGKTLIAVLLLRHILEKELEERHRGSDKKVAFFLVDTVALCFQQFAVLEANIDRPIARLCGNVNFDTFNKPSWQNLFENHDVVVCTAEILYQSLGKSFITMDRINIMVFDEAHHCKKSHPYARIIKEFYVNTIASSRPRLFGMSASPVDSKEDVEDSAMRLETLLHCHVATTSDFALLQQHNISRPEELLIQYSPAPRAYATQLGAELEKKYKHIRAFSKLFASTKEIASELGEWCADQLWGLALSDEEVPTILSKREQEYRSNGRTQSAQALNEELMQIREAAALVSRSVTKLPYLKSPELSEKALHFIKYICELYENSEEPRCLVFVQRRATATLLANLLRKLGCSNIHLGVLVGVRRGSASDQITSVRQQMLTILNFRQGDLNLLIATSVAEEGLDIPNCNYIVRFDLYSTMIQYVQSRGRARHANSKFIVMVENGNYEQRRIIHEARQGEMLMRQFCNTLPKDRLLEGNDSDAYNAIINERNLPLHKEEAGAQLSFNSAMDCLAFFVQSIPQKEVADLTVTYEMFYDGRNYTCEVTLPEGTPLHSIAGRPYSKKVLAKRSAAFEACLTLRAKGYLNNELLPIYTKQLPAMRNAHLALNVKKSSTYDMRVKPTIWKHERGSKPSRLCAVVLSLCDQQVLGRPAATIALLTRSQLPSFPSFPLFPGPSRSTEVIINSAGSVEIDEQRLETLTSFTLNIFMDLYNKKYENDPINTPYWFAPVQGTNRRNDETLLTEQEWRIDWAMLEQICHAQGISWQKNMSHAELTNKFLIDRWDGGRRFFSIEVEETFKPSDPLPEGCAAHKNMTSIIDYSVSLFKKSRQSKCWDMNQPVIRAFRIPACRNWLQEWSREVKEARTLAYVCPEPLKISALPVSIAAMGYALPSIVHRIEEYLICQEAISLLGLELPLDLCLEALTKDSDNTEEHNEEQMHMQRGMGKNYERLEFIGDCFLKMATSISLYIKYANDDEFESHVKRMIMICNKNLFNHARERRLFEYIRTKSFNRRTWYPQGLKLLEGKGKNLTNPSLETHELNDKTIADVCEAIMGAALLSEHGSNSMDMAVRAVTILVQSEDHTQLHFSDYAAQYSAPAWVTETVTATQTDLAEQIARIDSYQFQEPRLLRSAFLHPSYGFAHERIPCYQRLEFLGDALLDMACVNFLFHGHPGRDPQWLTEHKMAMVSNKFLGALCVRLGFHRHLRHSNAALVHAISSYATELEEARRAAADSPDYWMAARAAPKCLPDVVEAYIGALFVDSGFNFEQVERFFLAHIAPFFRNLRLYDSFANRHPTTFLANVLNQHLGCSHFAVLADELPTVENGRVVAGGCGVVKVAAAALVHGRVVGEAQGASIRYAKVRASKAAAAVLQNLDRQTFRQRYRCDCKEEDLNQAFDADEERADDFAEALQLVQVEGEQAAATVQSQLPNVAEADGVHAITAIGGLVAGNGRGSSERAVGGDCIAFE